MSTIIKYGSSGAWLTYNKAVNRAGSHASTFKNCGKNTVSGTAELAQIPTSWGGTMSA